MIRDRVPPPNDRPQRRQFAVLGLIFLLSISSLLLIYVFFPEVDPYVRALVLPVAPLRA